MTKVEFSGAGHCSGTIPDGALNSDFAIELLIEDGSTSGYVYSVGSSGNKAMILFSSGKLSIGNANGWASWVFSAGVWRFVHDTSETGFARYTATRNGVAVTQDSTFGSYVQNAVPVSSVADLARRNIGASYYTGVLGDLKVWDAAVAHGDADQTTDLVLSLGDITGSTWDDTTAGSNDYTLNGDAAEVVVAASLTVSGLSDWDTIQRDGLTGDIAISGSTANLTGDVEASFAGGDYATIGTISSNSFSGTLSDQPLVRGDLVVRSVDSPGTSQTISNLGIGCKWLLCGDSISEGRGTNAQSHGLAASLAPSVLRQDGISIEANDPMDTGTSSGSHWPLLAKLLTQATGIPQGFVTTGTGSKDLIGDGVEYYSKGNAGYTILTSQATAGGGSFEGLLLHLGPNAATDNTITAAEYKTAIKTFVADVRTDIQADLPVYLGCYGESAASTNNLAIRWGIVQALLDDDGPLPGPNALGLDFADGVHPKTDAELATFAARWFAALNHVTAPNPIGATFDDDTVTVTFDQDLAAGTTYTASQWRLNQDDTLSTPSTVTRTGRRTIDLVFASSITATAPTLRFVVDETHVSATLPTSVAIDLPSTINTVSTSVQPANPTFDLPVRPLTASGGGADLDDDQKTALTRLFAMTTAGNEFNATALANVSNAGWDETELSQIRHRLGIDGTKEAPSESSPQLTVTVASTSVISVETPNADDAGRFTITQRDDYENDNDIAPIGPIRISTTQGLLRETNPPTLRFGATQLLGRKYGQVYIIGDAYAEAVAGEPNQYDLYIEIGRDELDKVPGDYGWDIEAVYNDNDVSTLVRGTMTLKQSMGDHEDRVA